MTTKERAVLPKYFVWSPQGRIPKFEHSTYELAYAEMLRLCKAKPGNSFMVLQNASNLYTYKEDVCIPQNPSESGWHWINNKEWNYTFPKFWSTESQKWLSESRTNLTAEKATEQGWVYDKPCVY